MAQGTTLREARHRIWPELSEWELMTAAGTSSGADANRSITTEYIVSEMADSMYGHAWVYCLSSADPLSGANVGIQRRALQNAINRDTGIMSLSQEFPAPPQAGDVFEVTKKMPCIAYMGHQGLREAINQGLAHWPIEDYIPMVGTGAYQYALDALPFMGDAARIIGLYDPPLFAGGNYVPSWRQFNLLRDFETPQLEIIGGAYTSGEAFRLRVVRDANTRIWDNSAAAWVDSTAGLVEDLDRALVEPNIIQGLGLWKAYSILAGESSSAQGSRESYKRDAAIWGATMQRIKDVRVREFGGWPITPEAVGEVTWAKSWRPGG